MFKKATRSGTKALLGFYGESGSGKTLSALLVARGLVGPDGLVMMADTESRRGEYYADDIPGGYEVTQLTEPFSSKRYSDVIHGAEQAAAGRDAVLVIDSFSHEWEGSGGVVSAAETIAEARAKRFNKEWDGTVQFGDWKQPKIDHKRMMLQMLASPLHIICCLRAQYASHQIDKKDYEKFGITSNARTTVLRDDFQTPIQDKNFIYEMMANVELSNKNPGVPILRKPPPPALVPAFFITPTLSIETGAAIAEWTRGGAPNTEDDAALLQDAKDAASCGTAAYQRWFKEDITNEQRHYLAVATMHHQKFKADAELADQVKDSETAEEASDAFPGDR